MASSVFPFGARMKIVSPVVERGNGHVAVCSVLLFFFYCVLEGQLSVKFLGFGMQRIAGCLGLLARSSDWSCADSLHA